MQITEGKPNATGRRFAVVVARFNAAVTDSLLEGALEALRRYGVREDDVHVVRVPGAFEIPLAARNLAGAGVDGVVCLGAVIRGQTPHFAYIANEVARGIAEAMLATGIPISFGVLTTDTPEQALARAGGAVGNKGYEAAMTALEMVDLLSRLHLGAPKA